MTTALYNTPPYIAPQLFSDADAALAQVQAIYRSSIEHLRDALQRFVAGEEMHERVRACYPFVRIQTETVARADSPLDSIEGLKAGCKIALTDNKDVKLIGLRLLEAADLTEADVQWQLVESYQAAARMTIKGEVDIGFFLAEAYNSLSRLTKTQLKPLMESKLADITHVLLIHHASAPAWIS